MLCRKVLDEAGMPRRVGDSCAGSSVIFQSGQMGSLCQDAVKQLTSAVRRWSLVGIDEHRSQIVDTLMRIRDCVAFADDCATLVMAEAWHDLVNGWEVHLRSKGEGHPTPLVPADVADAAREIQVQESWESVT